MDLWTLIFSLYELNHVFPMLSLIPMIFSMLDNKDQQLKFINQVKLIVQYNILPISLRNCMEDPITNQVLTFHQNKGEHRKNMAYLVGSTTILKDSHIGIADCAF